MRTDFCPSWGYFPRNARPPEWVEPFIANIVAGIHQAFSLAVAQTFWIGVAAAIVAAIAAVGMQELTLRTSQAPAPEARARLTSAPAAD